MRNILLRLRFDGTAYHGWQEQKALPTVQGVLQEALGALLGAPTPVTGCSRTDAGVHALGFACNFHTESGIPCEGMLRALNDRLPPDAAVWDCVEVPPDFHARFDATQKEYRYLIRCASVRDPFWRARALHCPYPLDCAAMDEAAQGFLGTHDFSSLRAVGGSGEKNPVRTVRFAHVQRDGETVVFTVRADGFLYNMVRIMAGTLLYVSQGKLSPRDIPAVLESRRRDAAGPTAPACGLYLAHVFYDRLTDAKE